MLASAESLRKGEERGEKRGKGREREEIRVNYSAIPKLWLCCLFSP